MTLMDIDHTAADIPIACALADRELAARRTEITENLLSGHQEVQELTDGYGLRFTGDAIWAGRLLDFIMEERACCPFFTFELIFAPQQGPI